MNKENMTTATVEERRRLIPNEYVIKFKQMFRGLEIDAVLGDRVLVDEVEPYTEVDAAMQRSGIVPPQAYYDANGTRRVTEKPRACTGIVVTVGDGVTSSRIREGAAVCFGPHAGTEYYIGGAKFRILDVSEILGVLRAVEGSALTDVIAPVKAG